MQLCSIVEEYRSIRWVYQIYQIYMKVLHDKSIKCILYPSTIRHQDYISEDYNSFETEHVVSRYVVIRFFFIIVINIYLHYIHYMHVCWYDFIAVLLILCYVSKWLMHLWYNSLVTFKLTIDLWEYVLFHVLPALTISRLNIYTCCWRTRPIWFPPVSISERAVT